jgi:hypothetical protein
MMTTRRNFLRNAAALAALSPVDHRLLWAQGSNELTLSVLPDHHFATMPSDFVGLSYESAQLGHPDFFSAQNTALIGIFRTISPHGILRIGGNTGEYTVWSANDGDAAKNNTPHAMGPDAGTAAKTASIITPAAIRNLNDFVTQVGWRVIYGLNLWHGTPENAAAEAVFVAKTLGSKLICFQIGNEPDMDHDAGSKERWSFEHYWERWPKYVAAVRAAVPDAKFAGPDIAKEYSWLPKMAAAKPDILFLSGHYYAEGPPADPRMTLEFLLKRGRNPATEEFAVVREATKTLGKGYRMTEGNSCFHGGKPLVSDTLASALWGGDYLLQLAQEGYLGANLHGGGNGLYTPIAGDTPTGFTARPVCYGMMLAERFAGSTFVEASLSQQSGDQNVTAFAARNGSRNWKLAIFNKAASPANLRLSGIAGPSSASIQWLQGPAIDSHTGITLGGSTLGANGEFAPKSQATLKLKHGAATLTVPAYTAALIES